MRLLVITSLQTQDTTPTSGPNPGITLKPVIAQTDRVASLNGDPHPLHVGLIIFGFIVLLAATLLIRRPFFRRRSGSGSSTSLKID